MSDSYPLLHEAKSTWLDLEIVGRCLWHSDTLIDFYRDPALSTSPLVCYAWVYKVHVRDLAVPTASQRTPCTALTYNVSSFSLQLSLVFWGSGPWLVYNYTNDATRIEKFSSVSRLVSPRASGSPPHRLPLRKYCIQLLDKFIQMSR